MRIVLGIDGGGTQTQACIADESGRVLAMASAGPGNFQSIGVEQAVANVRDAERRARVAAGIGEHRYDAVFVGLAGAGSDADRAAVLPYLVKLNLTAPGTLHLDHDMRIAHAGALLGRPGIVVIAGTGSAVFGVSEAGETMRACGWGSAFDDPGSAYDIGRRAISEVIAVADGRSESSAMSRRVTASLLGLSEPELRIGEPDSVSPDLGRLRAAVLSLGPTGEGRAKVAALAPLVLNIASDGDAAAQTIVREAVQPLARGVKAVAHRLRFNSPAIMTAIVGGLTKGGGAYLSPLHQAILEAAPQVRVTEAELSPVVGAVILALQSIGVSVDQAVIGLLKRKMK